MRSRRSRLLRGGWALLLVMLLLAGCAAAKPKAISSRAGTFSNPVYVGGKDNLPESPDPMAIKYNGEYYAYVTGDPCLVLTSPDLVNWKLAGPMLQGRPNCWAPSVTYKNGTFYAYAATVQEGGGEASRRVRLYTSQTPTGPFVLQGDVTDVYSYDPGYFMDADGKEYLYWTETCDRLPNDCSGNANVVDQLVTMQKLSGHLTQVTEATDWECKDRCIMEAPSVTKHNGLYYLLYSGSAYENEHYAEGWAKSKVPMGPGGVADKSWTKGPRVLQTVELITNGPGGASWVTGPNNLDDWTIYHGRGYSRETLDRWLRIDPVLWGRDQFWLPGAPTGGPKGQPVPAPALPQFADRFDRADAATLGSGWAVNGGAWAVKDGQVVQSGAAGAARAIAGPAAGAYVAEVNVKPAGRAGMYAYYADDQNNLRILLDPAAKAVVWNATVGGKTGQPSTVPLPADFRFDVYHQLLVTKNGDRFLVSLDGRLLMGFNLAFKAPGKIGLATDGAAAAFDGVAMTEGWEDFEGGAATLWGAAADGATAASGQWAVDADSLVQSQTQGKAQAFKGDRTWGSYQFSTDLQLVQKGSGAKLGVYAAYFDASNYVQVLIDPDAGTLTSQFVQKGKPQPATTTDLKTAFPNGLDISSTYHTLQVTKNGFSFTVVLDGVQVQQFTANLPTGQPGLVMENAAVRYDSIHVSRWD